MEHELVMRNRGPGKTMTELRAALMQFKSGLWGVGALSAVINILALSSSLYLMLIYDRVLASQSMPTLISIGIIFTMLFIFHGVFDVTRSLLLNGIGTSLDQSMTDRVQKLQMELAARDPTISRQGGPVRDLDQIRTFLSGAGPSALMDLPWVLFFLAILFLMHFWLGITALFGVIVLAIITYINERMTVQRVGEVNGAGGVRSSIVDRNLRHSATIRALGMGDRAVGEARAANDALLEKQSKLSEVASTLGGISRVFRIFLQSLVLSVGAVLVIQGEATGGIIFASSILAGRALAPVDQVIANWRGFVGARQSWARLNQMLEENPVPMPLAVTLPPPANALSVQRISLAPPGSQRISLVDVSFDAKAGEAVGILGPSGSGKSSLARAIAGVWIPQRGAIRLDGATLDQWDRDTLGRHIGYLPQEIELFSGTIGDNISRGDPGAPSEKIVAAAQAAGVHDLILQMPDGYGTNIGYDGMALSAGQRQRVALARALYGDPFMLVLDEPNSNLDPEGEQALFKAIQGVRQRKGLVILVTHQPAILRAVSQILVLRAGQVQAWGPRDEVLAKLQEARNAAANPDKKGGPGGLAVVN